MPVDSERLEAVSATMTGGPRSDDWDPVVTGLITKRVGDRHLSSQEVVGMIRLLLSAGHNSTTSALGISILRIAADAKLQERLRRAPEQIPRAIEEILARTRRISLDGDVVRTNWERFGVSSLPIRFDR